MLTINVFGKVVQPKREATVSVCIIQVHGKEVVVPATAIFKGTKRIKKGFLRKHGLL